MRIKIAILTVALLLCAVGVIAEDRLPLTSKQWDFAYGTNEWESFPPCKLSTNAQVKPDLTFDEFDLNVVTRYVDDKVTSLAEHVQNWRDQCVTERAQHGSAQVRLRDFSEENWQGFALDIYDGEQVVCSAGSMIVDFSSASGRAVFVNHAAFLTEDFFRIGSSTKDGDVEAAGHFGEGAKVEINRLLAVDASVTYFTGQTLQKWVFSHESKLRDARKGGKVLCAERFPLDPSDIGANAVVMLIENIPLAFLPKRTDFLFLQPTSDRILHGPESLQRGVDFLLDEVHFGRVYVQGILIPNYLDQERNAWPGLQGFGLNYYGGYDKQMQLNRDRNSFGFSYLADKIAATLKAHRLTNEDLQANPSASDAQLYHDIVLGDYEETVRKLSEVPSTPPAMLRYVRNVVYDLLQSTAVQAPFVRQTTSMGEFWMAEPLYDVFLERAGIDKGLPVPVDNDDFANFAQIASAVHRHLVAVPMSLLKVLRRSSRYESMDTIQRRLKWTLLGLPEYLVDKDEKLPYTNKTLADSVSTIDWSEATSGRFFAQHRAQIEECVGVDRSKIRFKTLHHVGTKMPMINVIESNQNSYLLVDPSRYMIDQVHTRVKSELGLLPCERPLFCHNHSDKSRTHFDCKRNYTCMCTSQLFLSEVKSAMRWGEREMWKWRSCIMAQAGIDEIALASNTSDAMFEMPLLEDPPVADINLGADNSTLPGMETETPLGNVGDLSSLNKTANTTSTTVSFVNVEEAIASPVQYLDTRIYLNNRTRSSSVEAETMHRSAVGSSESDFPMHTPRSLVFERYFPAIPLTHALPVFLPRNMSDYAVTKGDLEGLPLMLQRLEDALLFIFSAGFEIGEANTMMATTAIFWDVCQAASFNRDGSLHFNVYAFQPLLELESPLPAISRLLVNIAHEVAHDVVLDHDYEHTVEQEHVLAFLSPRVWPRAALFTSWENVKASVAEVPVVVPVKHDHASRDQEITEIDMDTPTDPQEL